MKFGEQLNTRMNSEWRFYYMDYDGLKKLLKERTSATGAFFAEHDEAAFVQALEKEVEKVFDFRDVKGGELTRHVQYCENQVHAKKGDMPALQAMEKEVSRITSELTELANFTRLNYTGFIKILKKHDKHTAFMLKPMFMVRLNTKPLYLENLDNLILRLSKLYDIIRTGDQRAEPVNDTSSGGGQTFVRKTTKYWVHPDNVTELKCLILRHLPVYVFENEKREIDPAISSVYYDNEETELYNGRLEKTEGAIALRFRWYGRNPPSEVFVERKTHREDWTGETSIKSRFMMKEKHVNDYIAGNFTLDHSVDKLRQKKAKKEEDLEEMLELSREIQTTIVEKKLRPTMRTFYNRTAFQLPGDARVRISLDTELTMIREDPPRNQGNWRRPDVLCEYPFNDLPASDVLRFPYAILEVKLQTQYGQEPPKWVLGLVQGHLVEEVPKFSKFIHGCATLLESKVTLFPFWLPQMDVDIRKPPPALMDDEDGGGGEFRNNQGSLDNLGLASGSEATTARLTNMTKGGKKKATSGGSSDERTEEEEDDDYEEDNEEGDPLLPLPVTATRSNTSGRGRNGRKKRRSNYDPFGSFKRVLCWGKRQSSVSGVNGADNNKPKKKIALPVRIEPKVYFANERTFLSWLHFTIVLGSMAAFFVAQESESARVTGYLFTATAVIFAVYALWLYQWRAAKIRARHPGPYDDRVGPVVLVIVFLIAIGINIAYHAESGSAGNGKGNNSTMST